MATKKPKSPILELLDMPNKGSSIPKGIHGILASLFRTILDDLGMNTMRWHSLMLDFLNDARNNVPDDRVHQTSVRGNLMKELVKDSMTWKVFCKGLRLLQPDKVEFVVRFYKNGRVTEHVKPVDFGPRSGLKKLLKDLDDNDPDKQSGTKGNQHHEEEP